MIQQDDSRFPLKYQAVFYGVMSLISFSASVSGMLVFNNLTVFSAGVLLFALVWPFTILAAAGYVLKEQMTLEKQLGDMTGEEGLDLESAMDDVAEMFSEVEEDEEVVEDAK